MMGSRAHAGSRGRALPPVVAIFGPTGTGKTELACRLADEIRCHLVSCDAVQVYRGFDAATAKPRGEALRHAWALVDCADPNVDFDLGTWVRAAEREIEKARTASRVPVVAGGSGLYSMVMPSWCAGTHSNSAVSVKVEADMFCEIPSLNPP